MHVEFPEHLADPDLARPPSFVVLWDRKRSQISLTGTLHLQIPQEGMQRQLLQRRLLNSKRLLHKNSAKGHPSELTESSTLAVCRHKHVLQDKAVRHQNPTLSSQQIHFTLLPSHALRGFASSIESTAEQPFQTFEVE